MSSEPSGLSAKVWKTRQVVFREGESSDGNMYYVLEGSFGAYKKLGSKQTEVQRIGPGQFFGEMALINKVPRAASIICISEEAKTVRIDRTAFIKMAESKPDFLFKILQAVLQRISNAHSRIKEHKENRSDDDPSDPFALV